MAGIPTASDVNESLDDLRGRWRFTLSRLRGEPQGAPLAEAFQGFEAQWTAADQKEMTLGDQVTDAEAAAFTADAALDALVDRVTVAIHGARKVDVDLPLHQMYFGSLNPSAFKRPILGTELLATNEWPALLAKAVEGGLRALAPKAVGVLKVAGTASAALSTAIANRDQFRSGGERKRVFDAFNALCASAYGGLKKFAHEHSELKLASDWAESFFPHGRSSSEPRTLEAANALVARLEQKLGKAKTAQAVLAARRAAHEAAVKAHEKARMDEAVARKAVEEAKDAERAAASAAKKAKPRRR